MVKHNTPDQIAFFNALAVGNIERMLASVANVPGVLDSFDYRNFGATPLTAACFSNRPAIVEAVIEMGADPNRKSDWSMGPWSPLHCALFRRDNRMAEYLLSHGATMDVHTAAGLGRYSEVARLLDDDPSRVVERGGDGCHPLHFADTADVAQLLLERGAEMDGRCIDHYSTPVQYLCSTRPEVARFLLSKGASPDIFSAVLCGSMDTLDKLMNANPGLIHARINQSFFPPGNEHDVYNILNFSIGVDATPLHAAAKSDRRESVCMLADRGLMPDIRGGYDQATPLHTAAWSNCPVSAEALLDVGADINARSGKIHNNSPAGWAVVAGSDKVFDLLINRGAECYEWFLDDARDALNGRFDQVSNASPDQRARIFSRLEQLNAI
ncbi:MAG: ankyrin repeat domain-containing protein [Planctomycetota bacterium]|nr:ankyrin repeat domain-containing protein [Planctomycetota bacterium]